MPHSSALDGHIRQKVSKLEEFFDRIIGCKVTVQQQQRHQQQGRQFNVRIHLTVPGSAIDINRDHDGDVYVALRDAFDAAKRKLEDHCGMQRGQVKAHEVPRHGHVARLFPEEGYGFIKGLDGQELYFSRANVVAPGFDSLQPGVEVQFLEEIGAEGPQAKRISVGKHHVP
jgi:ribosomal subunit interface protein